MRYARAAIVAAILAAATAAWPAAQKERRQLHELRERIADLQKKLADSEGSRAEAADALKASERAISDANRALLELNGQIRDADARLAGLREETAGHERQLKQQQALLERALYQQYVTGASPPLKLLLNRENPEQIARDLHYFGYISRARLQLIAELRANLARLDELAREAEQQSAELAQVTRKQREQR